jgi:hypothetical protein
MRDFLALGVVFGVVFAGMAACSDDDPGGPGVGGSGGSAGSAGGGGMSGTSGMGGAAGSGGQAGGAAGGPVIPPPDVSPQATCTGCVELIAPVVGPRSADNTADEASYIFSLGGPIDFSNAVITWRVAAVQPNANYVVTLLAQDGQALNYAGAYLQTALDPAAFPANQFRDIVLDLTRVAPAPGADAGADAGDPDAGADAGAVVDAGDAGGQPVSPPINIVDAFDKSQIIQIGLFVGVNEGFSGSATVRVAVDQVIITGVPGQADHTFTTDVEGLAINQYNIPPGTPPPVHHP